MNNQQSTIPFSPLTPPSLDTKGNTLILDIHEQLTPIWRKANADKFTGINCVTSKLIAIAIAVITHHLCRDRPGLVSTL
ncbi:MAG: hypothetical protein ACOC07_16915 [Coleofasciculus sp.]